ncbi:MAG: tetratricopeptide repeat protein [Hyphomicrobiaceae bacterium]|nr:tetratricopeptide repeat protein [Hyphomicrobiaceae bacterium]
MTWLINLYTTFDGRISRQEWWIGTVILIVVSGAGQWIMAPGSFDVSSDSNATPSPVHILWSVIVFVPALAITFKRFNDRDQPRLLSYVFAGVYVVCTVLSQFLPAELEHFDTWEWTLAYPFLLFSLWTLIDNGFLKGTKGPNRYGADPLDPGSGEASLGTVPQVGRTPYTGGAFLRDAIIGLFALGWGAYLFLPNVNMEVTGDLLDRLMLGESYKDHKRWKLVDKHLALYDPEGEKEESRLNKLMAAHAQGRKDYQKGISASFDKKHADAVRDFTLAIERYGADNKVAADIFLSRARSYSALNEPAKARKDYSVAIALRPGAPEGYSARGNFNVKRKRYEKALADFDQAIRVLRVPEAYYENRRGYVLRKLERPQQALGAYDKAISQAKAKYERLMEIDRDLPDLTKEERETFEKWAAKKRNRSIRRAELGRGKAFRDLGRLDDAIAAFDHAIELSPDAAYAYVERGWIYEKKGQLNLAMANYERAQKLGSTSDWLKKAIARVKPKLNY